MSKDLGKSTSYAYYVAEGGTKTPQEYGEMLVNIDTVATRAEDAADAAAESATGALNSKNAAQTAATTATNKATEATTAATTATTKAGEASTSASTATSAKDTAVSASQTATTKATEATTAAATATSAKTDAVAANTAAQSAKTAAQTAQKGAETAAASVQSSAAQIATNTEDIESLKSELTEIVYVPTMKNGSFTNPSNATGIAFGESFTINEALGAWITINIPLSDGQKFHINLDGFSATEIQQGDLSSRTFTMDPYLQLYTNTFYIDFDIAVPNIKSFALSILKKDAGGNNIPLRVESFGNAVTMRYELESKQSQDNKVFIKNSAKGVQTLDLYSDFELGNLSGGQPVNAQTRVISKDFLVFDSNITLTPASGYRFGVHTFVNGTFNADSGWKTSAYTIPANTVFKIVIGKIEDTGISDVGGVDKYVRSVTFTENNVSMSVPWESDMHRGYSSPTVHENTIPAFYRAWKNGATMIEVDARLSSDGIYVSNHDATITVGGTTYTIANETADTLTHLVLSTDATYGDCCIPLLETVLNLCCYTGMKANVDCKQINPTTLAKLVVDCGMSGKVMYANTSIANAQSILATDPNAGFIFEYSEENLSWWATALTEYHTRQRSYAWSPNVSYDALEKTRSYGFKYLLAGVTITALMSYVPDCVEFEATANCKVLNDTYINSLSFVP